MNHPEIEHGLYSSYTNRKCRCVPCTQANADYKREWFRERARLVLMARAMEQLIARGGSHE